MLCYATAITQLPGAKLLLLHGTCQDELACSAKPQLL
jgi:hypothetical protein